LIQEDDIFNFVDLSSFAPDKPLTMEVTHADGSKDTIVTNHTYNAAQILWFHKGSALNKIKEDNAA
jgi:aconitate hydratase